MNTRNRIRVLVGAATLVIVISVIAGLIAIGPPELQRKRKLDEQRLSDLANISQRVKFYSEQKKQLPPDISVLAKQPGVKLPIDPETGQAYEYSVTGENAYRLCATFTLDSADQKETRYYVGANEWPHGIGRTCFDRQIKEH
jgi:hypothetical protein